MAGQAVTAEGKNDAKRMLVTEHTANHQPPCRCWRRTNRKAPTGHQVWWLCPRYPDLARSRFLTRGG